MTECDFIGCGSTPPDANWPGGARVALNIVLLTKKVASRPISTATADPVMLGQRVALIKVSFSLARPNRRSEEDAIDGEDRVG